MTTRWFCPNCFTAVLAPSEAQLNIEVGNHIREHERDAVLRALESAGIFPLERPRQAQPVKPGQFTSRDLAFLRGCKIRP